MRDRSNGGSCSGDGTRGILHGKECSMGRSEGGERDIVMHAFSVGWRGLIERDDGRGEIGERGAGGSGQ